METDKSHEFPWLDVPLAEVPISARAYRRLIDAGYRTLAEVSEAGRAKLGLLPGFGATCQREVWRLCKQYRREYLRQMLASGRSLRQAGKELGVSGECVRKWVQEK